MTLLYCVICGDLWLQLVELCCLYETGYHEFMEKFTHTYGTIVRLWIGPHLVVVLTETKYVEVSTVASAV